MREWREVDEDVSKREGAGWNREICLIRDKHVTCRLEHVTLEIGRAEPE